LDNRVIPIGDDESMSENTEALLKGE